MDGRTRGGSYGQQTKSNLRADVVPLPNGATQPRTGEETTVPTANKNYIIRTRLTRFNTGYIAGVGPLQYKQERPPITHNIVQERE